jgi:hypothetical protein
VKRADQGVAQHIQLAAKSEGASQQLMSGVDANNDGRISWEPGEGGLQQAQQHMELLLKGEGAQ